MSPEEIREKIIQSIQKQQNKGMALVCDDWGSTKEGCACALGCVLEEENIGISSDGSTNYKEIAKLFGETENWVESFIYGFDETPPPEKCDKEALVLGTELTKQFKPIPKYKFDRLKNAKR